MYLGLPSRAWTLWVVHPLPARAGSALSQAAMTGMPRVPAVRQVMFWETMRAGAGSRGRDPRGLRRVHRPEKAASQLTWYESEVVSGLLQAGAYARTLIKADNPELDEEEISRGIEVG